MGHRPSLPLRSLAELTPGPPKQSRWKPSAPRTRVSDPPPDTTRGRLEAFIGQLDYMIQSGKFAEDPALERHMARDRDSSSRRTVRVRRQRDRSGRVTAIAATIPALDEGSGLDLLRTIAGTPDPDPHSLGRRDDEVAGRVGLAKAMTTALTTRPEAVWGVAPSTTRDGAVAGSRIPARGGLRVDATEPG